MVATDANFKSHSVSRAGLRPNKITVSALTTMARPKDAKQVRALMGGINYCRKQCSRLDKEAPSDELAFP